MPKQAISDDLKKQLGIFRDYVNLSPSGKSLMYLRVTESLTAKTPSSAGESIEVWRADKDGLHSAKLGEIPFLWEQVIWLDNEKRVLLTIAYESIDSGIEAYSFDIENRTAQKLFASVTAVRGIPTSLSASPDERWIALTTYGQGDGNGIWIVDRNSNSARRIDSAYAKAQPLWSEDSRYIYYVHSKTTYFPDTLPSESPYLARYDISSQSTQPLTSAGDIGIPLISEWAVSGDGKHFLFEADSGLGYLDEGLWSLTLNSR
jgi:Tol biopolymer transport system component